MLTIWYVDNTLVHLVMWHKTQVSWQPLSYFWDSLLPHNTSTPVFLFVCNHKQYSSSPVGHGVSGMTRLALIHTDDQCKLVNAYIEAKFPVDTVWCASLNFANIEGHRNGTVKSGTWAGREKTREKCSHTWLSSTSSPQQHCLTDFSSLIDLRVVAKTA